MATINYTRTTNSDPAPIDAEGIRAWIQSQTGYTTTYVEVHPTSIDATGSGVVSGHSTAIQAAIDSYVYPAPLSSLYIPVSSMDNTFPMVDSTTKIATVHSSVSGDAAALALAKTYADTGDATNLTAINKKTAVRFWDAGTFQNGAAATGDIIVMTDTTTIASGGNAVFNLTGDHTSSGTALCSSILANSCVANFVDSTGVFSQGAPTVAGNLKTVTIAATKQTQSGVVLLSTTIVGSVTQPAAANGTIVRFFGIGIAA